MKRHSIKDIFLTNKHMKNSFTQLVIGKMQIKTTIIHYYKHISIFKFSKTDHSKARCWNYPSALVEMENVKALWKSPAASKVHLLSDLAIPLLIICPKKSSQLLLLKRAQSCLTLCDSMDCSPPDSSVHGILQERILEQVAMPSSRESS